MVNNPQNSNYNVWQMNNKTFFHQWRTFTPVNVSGATVTLQPADAAQVDLGDIVIGGASLPVPPANPATVTQINGNVITVSATIGSATTLSFGRPAVVFDADDYVQGTRNVLNGGTGVPNAGTPGSVVVDSANVVNNLGVNMYKFNIVRMFKGSGNAVSFEQTIDHGGNANVVHNGIVDFVNNTQALKAVALPNTPNAGQVTINFPLPEPVFFFEDNATTSIVSQTAGSFPTGVGSELLEQYDKNSEKEYAGYDVIGSGNVYRVAYMLFQSDVNTLGGNDKVYTELVVLVNNSVAANANNYITRINTLFP